MDITERFLNYTKFDTQSSEESESVPSTSKQLIFANYLKEELERVGLSDVEMDEMGYIYATLKANTKKKTPTIGFISHYDTSPDCSGANIKARIVRNYDGGDIELSEGIVSSPSKFPELKAHVGEDLIVTDGTTLLGADDKAGVAEIMAMLHYYKTHPDKPHRTICAAFTPDEEVGRGTEQFSEALFGAREAYTVDGGKLGEIEYECFNAAAAKVEIRGRSVHPGSAKHAMLNALGVAMEFHAMLPAAERPEHTEGYEGFYHLDALEGDVENAVLRYIIRDHDKEKFEQRKAFLQKVGDYLNDKYRAFLGGDPVRLTLRDQYYNMAIPMKDHLHLVTNAEQALRELGVEPAVVPIRGGTDGAALTYRGIPCPNLCTGGCNFHGRFEYASVPEMLTTCELLVKLAAK